MWIGNFGSNLQMVIRRCHYDKGSYIYNHSHEVIVPIFLLGSDGVCHDVWISFCVLIHNICMYVLVSLQ